MLPDFGWSELLIIGIVLIVVIGPKDLPRVMKGFSKGLKSMRKMSDDFRKQFSDALDEAELSEMRDLANEVKGLDPRRQIKDALAPLGKMGADLTNDIKKATDELEAPSMHPTPEFKAAVERPPSAAEQALAASGAKAKAAQPAAKAKVAPVTKTDVNPPAEPVGDATANTPKTPAKKPAAKKAPAKKPATPKTAPAKPAAKKAAPAKKPTAKKSAAKKTATKPDDVT